MSDTIGIPFLVGTRVKKVRLMTKKEMNDMGWSPDHIDGKPIVIEFENGVRVFPSCDPEGNHAGCLFGEYEGDGFIVEAEK